MEMEGKLDGILSSFFVFKSFWRCNFELMSGLE